MALPQFPARPQRPNLRAPIASIAGLLAVVLAACSSSSMSGASPSAGTAASGSTFSQRMSQLFSGGSQTAQNATATPAAPAPPPDFDCPTVDVRLGAGTFTVNANTSDSSALALRYQGIIGQTARECVLRGPVLTMKLGVQGRIILGPAGGPGQIDVPMRVAVVQEGPEPKTVWTKFYRIPVTISPGENNVSFTHIEEDMSFPMPRAAVLDAYVVYVGFDPQGLRAPQRSTRPPPKR